MNTIIFYFAVSLVALAVASVLPGVQHLVRPFVDLFFTLIKAVFENGIYWAIYVGKTLLDAHTVLLRHLALSPEDLDPTLAMRDSE